MPSGYGPWQASDTGGGGGGGLLGLLIVVAGVVAVVTSTAFANIVHDLMYAVLGVCGIVAVTGLGVVALVLRHHRVSVSLRPSDPFDPLRASVRPVDVEARRQVREVDAPSWWSVRPADRPAITPAPARPDVDPARMLRGHVVWDDERDGRGR